MGHIEASADSEPNIGLWIIPFFDRVENIVVQGENAGYQHSPLVGIE